MEKLFINTVCENYKSINMSPVSSLAWLCYSFPCNPENVIIKSNKNEIWKVDRSLYERCIYIVHEICSSKDIKERTKIAQIEEPPATVSAFTAVAGAMIIIHVTHKQMIIYSVCQMWYCSQQRADTSLYQCLFPFHVRTSNNRRQRQ